jgi:hypothetical protein
MWKKELIYLLKFAAVAGNILFILWILYNGINEGFEGTLLEKLSFVGLMILLALNSILLLNAGSKQPVHKTEQGI